MANNVVDEFCRQQVAVGVVIIEPVSWAMEGYVVASHARLAPLSNFLAWLLAVARKVFEVLWPETAAPTSRLQLIEWLDTAPGCVDEW
jgi:hypothetical protein